MNDIDYVSYDGNVDHLTIYKAGEKITSNIDTGLAILSFNQEKEIVGIELMGAHANFNLPLEALQNIQECSIDIKYHPERKVLIVNLLLKYENKENPVVCAYENIDLGATAFTQTFACAAA